MFVSCELVNRRTVALTYAVLHTSLLYSTCTLPHGSKQLFTLQPNYTMTHFANCSEINCFYVVVIQIQLYLKLYYIPVCFTHRSSSGFRPLVNLPRELAVLSNVLVLPRACDLTWRIRLYQEEAESII